MKKHWQKKTVALVLALALALGPAGAFSAFAASALGGQLYDSSLRVGTDLELLNGMFWNNTESDKVTENYLEYSPGGEILPMVIYGHDIYGAASAATAVSYAETEEDKHVVALINGDIFNTANGVANGLVVKDGIIRSSESTAYRAVGFKSDGSVVIGSPGLSISASSATNASFSLSSMHLNKVVTASSGVVLFSEDFGDATNASVATYNVLLQVLQGQASFGGQVTARVTAASSSTGSTGIPDGSFLLSMAESTTYTGTLSALKSLQVGDVVTFNFQATNSDWYDVVNAVGSYGDLLRSGVNVASSGDATRNPRTALGVKADGSVVLYTVDGRQSGHSIGSSLYSLAYRMMELGCVEAVNLDGGGSTALQVIYPGDSALSTVNQPSGGSLRSCGNYIVLVNTAQATGELANLHLYPYDVWALAGAELSFTVKATDENYYAVSPPSRLEWDVEEGLGTVSGSAVVAGSRAGSGNVTVSGGGASGTARLTVVTAPDSLSVLRDGSSVTSLSVAVGDQVDLTGRAAYNGVVLSSGDRCYEWAVTGNIGTVDEDGVFTATNRGSGTITASAGGLTASVAVTVEGAGALIDDFEDSSGAFRNVSGAALTTGFLTDLTRVRYGRQSLALAYDFNQAEGDTVLSVPVTASFSRSPSYLSFWIYGDGSGNSVGFSVTAAGASSTVTAATLDFTGWRQVITALPAGTTAVTSFNITGGGSAAGTLYLDQVQASSEGTADVTAPTVTLSLSGRELAGTISDQGDPNPVAENINVTYDGAALALSLAGSLFTASLPEEAEDSEAAIHRVVATVKDQSGNLGKAALTIESEEALETQPFVDMEGHWAVENTTYLYSQGVINGVERAEGLYYQPDNNMTRSEFAVIMANWLVEDLSAYSAVSLPFADAASIPAWALEQVKAMYSLGYIQGSRAADGSLYFNPLSSISREEAMTIIGRTQERGYGEADLSSYADGASVSSWAAPYLKSLVAQGVISGYNNRISPKDYVTRGQMAKMVFELY
ncbi:MAG: phosphodiester glycosidase family protein [Bacillota bacterium]|nr:phosphodiester glycosidase family protein [Bacillota bacterium]